MTTPPTNDPWGSSSSGCAPSRSASDPKGIGSGARWVASPRTETNRHSSSMRRDALPRVPVGPLAVELRGEDLQRVVLKRLGFDFGEAAYCRLGGGKVQLVLKESNEVGADLGAEDRPETLERRGTDPAAKAFIQPRFIGRLDCPERLSSSQASSMIRSNWPTACISARSVPALGTGGFGPLALSWSDCDSGTAGMPRIDCNSGKASAANPLSSASLRRSR